MPKCETSPTPRRIAGGKMWILPAGVKMHVQTSLHTNFLSGFAWGLEMECSAWGTPISGCNGSLAQENQSVYSNMIGRLVLRRRYGRRSAVDYERVFAQGSRRTHCRIWGGWEYELFCGERQQSRRT